MTVTVMTHEPSYTVIDFSKPVPSYDVIMSSYTFWKKYMTVCVLRDRHIPLNKVYTLIRIGSYTWHMIPYDRAWYMGSYDRYMRSYDGRCQVARIPDVWTDIRVTQPGSCGPPPRPA